MSEVVIVDADGNEHHFPEGMDPKKAGEIVRGKASSPMAPAGSSDTIQARYRMNTQEGSPGLIAGLMDAGQGMAHPKGLLDLATLLVPSDLGYGGGAKFVRELAGRSYQALKSAGQETTGIRNAATLPVRAFGKFRDALPSSNAAAVEKFMGPESQVVRPTQTTINGADIIDRNMPKVRPAAVPKPPMAKTPTLNEALDTAMTEAMGAKDPALRSTGAPAVEATAGGGYKQSWTKTKKQNLGGYDSGNPSTTAAEANSVTPTVDNAVPTPPDITKPEVWKEFVEKDLSPNTDIAAQMADDDARRSLSPSEYAQFQDKADNALGRYDQGTPMPEAVRSEFGIESPSGVTVTPDAKPKLSVEETAAMMRRMFGSRDGGRMLYGDSLPASERGAALKRLAPGPSQTPLAAEARINGMPQDQSLEGLLRQIILDKSKVP